MRAGMAPAAVRVPETPAATPATAAVVSAARTPATAPFPRSSATPGAIPGLFVSEDFDVVGGNGRSPAIGRALDEILDHRLQTQLHAIVRVVNALDAIVHQRRNLLGRDRTAASAEHPDVRTTHLVE